MSERAISPAERFMPVTSDPVEALTTRFGVRYAHNPGLRERATADAVELLAIEEGALVARFDYSGDRELIALGYMVGGFKLSYHAAHKEYLLSADLADANGNTQSIGIYEGSMGHYRDVDKILVVGEEEISARLRALGLAAAAEGEPSEAQIRKVIMLLNMIARAGGVHI